MSCYGNLGSDDKARINFKLSELRDRTGKQWDYNVMDKRGQEDVAPLLEIIVDGRTAKPVVLPLTEKSPATVICNELESHAEVAMSSSKRQPERSAFAE